MIQTYCHKVLIAFLGLFILCNDSVCQIGIRLREGVLIDKKKNEILLINPNQELEIVSSLNGMILMNTKEKIKPIALQDGHLWGQLSSPFIQNNFKIVTIDLNNKANLIAKDSVFLPKSVHADILQDVNTLFTTKSKWIDNDLYILWEFQTKKPPLKGVRPDGVKGNDIELENGVIKFTNGIGKARLIQNESLEKDIQQSIIVAEELRVPNEKGLQYLSADKKHILVSEKVSPDTLFLKYNWKIYDRSGKLIGQKRDYRSYAPFYVSGDTLIYEVGPYKRQTSDGIQDIPLSIEAVKISTGQTLWIREILDNVRRINIPPLKKP